MVRAGSRPPFRLYGKLVLTGAGAKQYLRAMAADLAAFELLDAITPAALRARIEPAASLAEAVEGAVHVQDSTPEDL